MAFENLKKDGIRYLLTKLKDYFLQIKDAVKSVNGNEPDENGDISITSVPYAQNLESSAANRNYSMLDFRTAGGDGSIEDGDAWLMDIKGNNVHVGYVAESITHSISPEREDQITIEIDRDEFVSQVSSSGTIVLVYSTEWSANPASYGITITGTPVAGDTITIVYVKEERGTITVTNPSGFVSTGWNLYNHTLGYAKVKKYSHGYMVSGTYTALQYSATELGTKSSITVTDGNFDIPADGYVWVTGGNSSDTAIWLTWEDWTEEYETDFSAYSQTTVDLSDVMETYFPNGLMKAGTVVDEINLNLGTAIQRVERLDYTEENIAAAEASGREYEYDTDYIYLALATPVSTSVDVDGSFIADDHGLEYYIGTEIPVNTEILYGSNLKNKLERNVLTISQQTLTSAEQAQVQTNIGAVAASSLNTLTTSLSSLFKKTSYSFTYSLAANGALIVTKQDLGLTIPSGYKVFCVGGYTTGNSYVVIARLNANYDNVVYLLNPTATARNNCTLTIDVMYIKNGFGIS